MQTGTHSDLMLTKRSITRGSSATAVVKLAITQDMHGKAEDMHRKAEDMHEKGENRRRR